MSERQRAYVRRLMAERRRAVASRQCCCPGCEHKGCTGFKDGCTCDDNPTIDAALGITPECRTSCTTSNKNRPSDDDCPF